ncbi:DNA topoisomerase I [Candidatus Bathyarchaeota archaeon]|nr:DNA topoisomerase I [Candidatus Bathyarchaeota archaeon]
MKSLIHNGVLIPEKYIGINLSIKISGTTFELNDEQEEMALAWAKKIGTPYVEDQVFKENFHKDFSLKLGVKVSPGDVDYTEIYNYVLKEREKKATLSSEEKKKQANERKKIREENKEKYGWAVVDGEKIEIGNYTVEPNSIFMGRGQHPWRGMWKEGPTYEDIELNLSPDAPIPNGKWKKIVWDNNVIWIARWRDKLSKKMKYVWPSDSSFLKQYKDLEKYEKAKALSKELEKIQAHIEKNLINQDIKRRKIATVCYLIDHLKFRVGDEKDDEEEADTVGASTLRPEHICFNNDGTVTFDFLGKDSVRMIIKTNLNNETIKNLKEFSNNKREPLFEGVNSSQVSEFLNEIMPGLSAKVFRTFYATDSVNNKLKELKIKSDQPEYLKKHGALLANLEAAIICNHKRTIPKTWEKSLQKKKENLKKLETKLETDEAKFREKIKTLEKQYKDKLTKTETILEQNEEKQLLIKQKIDESLNQGKDIKRLIKQNITIKKKIKSNREQIRKIKNTYLVKIEKTKKQQKERKQRNQDSIKKMKLQVNAQELTKDYNLGTSLKNYIDPRIYYDWGKKIGFDWKKYYPATLQKKFSWIEKEKN